MIDDSSAHVWSLLPLCALLRWFDLDLLRSLATEADSDLQALLAGDELVALSEPPGAYALRPEIQAAALAQLRSEQPLAELELHARIFEQLVVRLVHAEAERRPALEAACGYHLDKLFFGLLPRLEWSTIRRHVAAARAVGLSQPRQLQRLALYEGYVAVRTQDYEQGEPLLTTLLEQVDLEPEVRMHALNALGQMHRNQTHYDRALTAYDQLQQIAAAADPVFQALAWLNMSGIYNELERYEHALELARQSQPIFQAHGEQVREAYALYYIGLNALYLGRWVEARHHLDAAIHAFEQLGIEAGLSSSYWSQGYLNHMLGDDSASETAYLRALELAQSEAHGDRLLAMDSCVYLGFLYATQGRWQPALERYAEALSLATTLRYEHRACLIAYQRGNVFKAQGRLDDALAAYTQAVGCIEQLRGATAGEDVKIGLLGTTQQVYEAIVLLCLELDRPADAFDYAERARSRAFLDMLHNRAPRLYAAADQPVVTLAELQAALPPDALLLEYFTTGVLPPGEHLLRQLPPQNQRLREHLLLPARIIIFAITHDSLTVYPVADALDPNTLQPDAADPAPGRRWLRPRALQTLHRYLIEPVAPLLLGRRLLYLIPHGPLHYLPFAALRSADGQYLVAADRPALAFAPSATVLLRNCLNRPARLTSETLAIGYNDRQAELRYAESEARLVARLMQGQVWTGPASKSAPLLAIGPHVRWLHIAGHATYNPLSPLDSTLHLGDGDTLSARTIIEQLELGAEIVTLSACTTGLSMVVPGDELLGFQRALLYAGAPTVLGTLWDAYDLVALLLMERFYAALCAGQSAAPALRDAQIAVREMTLGQVVTTLQRWQLDQREQAILSGFPVVEQDQQAIRPYADPEYWAPFMLTGRP